MTLGTALGGLSYVQCGREVLPHQRYCRITLGQLRSLGWGTSLLTQVQLTPHTFQ